MHDDTGKPQYTNTLCANESNHNLGHSLTQLDLASRMGIYKNKVVPTFQGFSAGFMLKET